MWCQETQGLIESQNYSQRFRVIPRILRQTLYCFFVVLLSFQLSLSSVSAGVTVEFILDGSGSMWGQIYEQYKVVIMKEGIENYLEKVPEGIRFAVRAFGLPGGEGCSNTTLLVKPALNAEQDVLRAAKRMNPTGQAPIIFSLRKGLKDLEGIEGKKVLILIADGSDTCEKDMAGAIEKLSLSISSEEIHVIGIGLKEEEDRTDLKLLAAKANGSFNTASNRTQIREKITRIISRAIQEEERRLRLLAEEQARMASLSEKTRLVVEFLSDVPGFFCTGIELVEMKVDDALVKHVEGQEMECSARKRIFDLPVQKGEHKVSITYRKENYSDVIRSRPQSFTVQVEPGKTTRLLCRTSAHLFYWGLDSEVEIGSAP